MSELLSIAASALRANQFALSVIGQNIASASDSDYSRQDVVFSSIDSQLSNQSIAGQGVVVQGTRRFYDQAIVNRLRQANSQLQSATITSQYAGQLSQWVSDANTSLTTQLQDFFNAFQDAANNPVSSVSRNQIISAANNLKNRFSSINQSVIDQFSSINQQISDNVLKINQISSQLAKVNSELKRNNATNTLVQSNALLDTRDKLLLQLSGLLDIKTIEQSNGSVNVFLKTGENIISGADSSILGSQANATLAQQPDVTLLQDGQISVITSHVKNGVLGGLIQYRDSNLKTFDTGFKKIASDLVADINKQHANGLTLSNAIGGDLFSTDLNSGSDLFTVSISNPNDIALSNPIVISSDSKNTGAGLINGSSILSTDTDFFDKTQGALNPPVIIKFDTATSYSILDKTIEDNNHAEIGGTGAGGGAGAGGNNLDAVIASNQVFLPGQSNKIFADSLDDEGKVYTGYQFVLSGAPKAGDVFNVDYNGNGFLDNTNANALYSFKDSFQLAYADAINLVNQSSSSAGKNQSAFDALFQQAKNDKQSLSGVNLDEEGVKLTQYQQAFNAATQMISIYKDLFDNLLRIF